MLPCNHAALLFMYAYPLGAYHPPGASCPLRSRCPARPHPALMAWGALRAAKRHSRAAESPSTSSATLPKEPYVRGGSCSARPSRCSPSPVSEMCTPPKIDGDSLPCALDYRALDHLFFFYLTSLVDSFTCRRFSVKLSLENRFRRAGNEMIVIIFSSRS